MSADEVADKVVDQVGDSYGFCVVNFANPDMVGHTGSIPAVIEAVQTVDRCLGRIVERVSELGGVCLVTADHGNAEKMLEADGISRTRPTRRNPVPLIVTIPERALPRVGSSPISPRLPCFCWESSRQL